MSEKKEFHLRFVYPLTRIPLTSVGISDLVLVGNPICTISHPNSRSSFRIAGGGTHCSNNQSLMCPLSRHTPMAPPVTSAILRQMCNSAERAKVDTRMLAAINLGKVSVRMCPGSQVLSAPQIIRISRLPCRGWCPRLRPATSRPF